MSAYLIVQIRVTEERRWSEYRTAVGPLAERFGGRYIMRGAGNVEVLEGAHDRRGLAVFEFATMEALHTFWNSPEYAALKKLREGAAELDAWAVPGV